MEGSAIIDAPSLRNRAQVIAVDRQHCPEAVEQFRADAAASFDVEARAALLVTGVQPL